MSRVVLILLCLAAVATAHCVVQLARRVDALERGTVRIINSGNTIIQIVPAPSLTSRPVPAHTGADNALGIRSSNTAGLVIPAHAAGREQIFN